MTAVAVVAPLVALPASFLRNGLEFDAIARTLLPRALTTSVVLGLGVGAATLVVGGSLAVLVSFYDFPGRRWLDWALVLPMAMPSYVLVYVVLGQYGLASPLQSNLFGDGFRIPGIRSTGGAIVVLTAVLYPYVYLLARSAFVGQSRQSIEAARSLGRSYRRAVWGVAVPLARPALAAGVSIAVMEALADFGTVDLLGVQALTSAIYRVWLGAFDKDAALQLSTVLVGLTLTMLAVERLFRGRARYQQALGRGDLVVPVRLRAWRGWLATLACVALLTAVFGLPVAQLVAWSAETIADGTVDPRLDQAIVSTLILGAVGAAAAVVTGLVVTYGLRVQPSRLGRATARLATVGYGVPGTVVAVAVYVPLIWVDRHLVDLADSRRRRRPRSRVHRVDPRARHRLPGPLPHAVVHVDRVQHGPGQPEPRRRRPLARRRPDAAAGRRPPPAAAARPGDGGPAGARRGDEGAPRHRAAPAARPRHARHHGVGGDEGLPHRHRRPAGAADRRRRAHPGDHPRPPPPGRHVARGGR